MYIPPIWPNGYILWYSVTFIWLSRIPFHQMTSNLGFSIPFHLYIHNHDLEEASGTLTCEAFMYVPPIWPNGYILWYSITFIWLRQIPIYKITSNLGVSILFHLYIHDHDLEEASGRYAYLWGVRVRHPDNAKWVHFMVFVYVYLVQTDTKPSNDFKSWF